VLGDMNRLQKQEIVTRLLLSGIVERYGARYSFLGLSRTVEKNRVTVIDYLRFMEDSFICFVLYAYDFNRKPPLNI
jgi:predicted AAA+ superfamily ATPase